MMTTFKSILAAAAISLLPVMGSAASLGLVTSGPSASVSNLELSYLDLGDGISGLTGVFGITSTDGVSFQDPVTGFLDVTFATALPNAADLGTLDLFFDPDLDSVIVGDFVGLGISGTTVELLFDLFGGSFEADFGSQVLLSFDVSNAGAPFSFGTLSNGDTLEGSAVIAGGVSPIPLPAGLPLLGAGLFGLWLLRQRKEDA